MYHDVSLSPCQYPALVVSYRCSWCSSSRCNSSNPSKRRSHHGLSHHGLPHHGLHHGGSRPSCRRLVRHRKKQSSLGFLKAMQINALRLTVHHISAIKYAGMSCRFNSWWRLTATIQRIHLKWTKTHHAKSRLCTHWWHHSCNRWSCSRCSRSAGGCTSLKRGEEEDTSV